MTRTLGSGTVLYFFRSTVIVLTYRKAPVWERVDENRWESKCRACPIRLAKPSGVLKACRCHAPLEIVARSKVLLSEQLCPILCPISITNHSEWAQWGRQAYWPYGAENQHDSEQSHSVLVVFGRSLSQRVGGLVDNTEGMKVTRG
jgi:hypothetical protein